MTRVGRARLHGSNFDAATHHHLRLILRKTEATATSAGMSEVAKPNCKSLIKLHYELLLPITYILLVYSAEWIRPPSATACACTAEEGNTKLRKQKQKKTNQAKFYGILFPCMPPTIKLKQSTTMCMLN